MVLLAIDPAVRRKGCGIAMFNDDSLLVHQNKDFTDAFRFALEVHDQCIAAGKRLIILTEAPRTKKSFGRKGGNVTAVNTGMGIGAMRIMADLLKGFGLEVLFFYPKDTKLSQSEFEHRTGYSGRTSADGRCAGMIIWNYIQGNHSPVSENKMCHLHR